MKVRESQISDGSHRRNGWLAPSYDGGSNLNRKNKGEKMPMLKGKEGCAYYMQLCATVSVTRPL